MTKTRSSATAWIMIAAVAAACSIILTVWPRTTNFHISAETESLDMQFRHTVPTTWRLDDVEIYRISQNANASLTSDRQTTSSFETASRFKQSRFSGRFLPQGGVQVRVSRPGSGALRFQFKSSGSGPVGVLYHSSGLTEVVKTRLVVVLRGVTESVAKHGTLVFPLLGAGELGAPVTLENRFGTSILRTGKISWLERTFLGGDSYVAGELAVDPGDVIEAVTDAPFAGALIVDENPAITAVFDVRTPALRVRRASTSTLTLATSWLARIRNDQSVQLAWSSTLLLIGFRTLFQRTDNEKNTSRRPRFRPALDRRTRR